MFWDKIKIQTIDGEQDAITPVIISASRSTDIPAFHGEWFINRLKLGYCKWINPFNQKPSYVSFSKTKAIVFWTKNPDPFLPYLEEIDKLGISYYFQYTLNDYEWERLEPVLEPLSSRLMSFKSLSKLIGKEKVIWRFDPLLLGKSISVEALIQRIVFMGEHLYPFSEKMVFSFADIDQYKKVKGNLNLADSSLREFTFEEKNEFVEKLSKLNNKWGFKLATCAEDIDLTKYGVERNRCVDGELLLRISKHDPEISKYVIIDQDLFGDATYIKDSGQRKECGCSPSKDIGMRDTCPHFCKYCYANSNEDVVRQNIKRFSKSGESIIL